MILSAMCFFFILSWARHVRSRPAEAGVLGLVHGFLLASIGYACGCLLVSSMLTLSGVAYKMWQILVFGVVPSAICLAGAAYLVRNEPAPKSHRLSDAEVTAIVELFGRYKLIIIERQQEMKTVIEDCSPEHLINLCDEAIKNHQEYPFDKLCRWMGFVQGVLATQGFISVKEERDFSRPLLHAVHQYTPPTYP